MLLLAFFAIGSKMAAGSAPSSALSCPDPLSGPPTVQASGIVFSDVMGSTFTINWTNGNGAKRAVFVKEGTGAITNPSNLTTYTASATWFSKGSQLGSSGYYCVYNGTGSTVLLTDLKDETLYTVQIFEYNGTAGSELYQTTTATNNPNSQTTEMCNAGDTWNTHAAAEGNYWKSVTYGAVNGSGLFVAVAVGSYASPGDYRVMTSPDGVTWAGRVAAEANQWQCVTYGNGLFVAVANSGDNRVMTSPDGINWTPRSVTKSDWFGVTYGNGIFVAVGLHGPQPPLSNPYPVVMTSPDGITWTDRTAPTIGWRSVVYGNGKFVSVGFGGTAQVMTSPDGITWTAQTATDEQWLSVTFGNNLFVAVGNNGPNRVMTSPDGITWTPQTPSGSYTWNSVTYGNDIFAAVGSSGLNIMTSPDGITWTGKTSDHFCSWNAITYGNGSFVAVGSGDYDPICTVTSDCGPLLRVTPITTHVNCFGNSNGAIEASVSNGTLPYTYLWSNGVTTSSISGLAPGTFTVTVTDATPLTVTASATVTQPALLTAQGSVTSHIICFGYSSGAVTVSASGGTTPYSYIWSNGNTNASVSNLPAGSYYVTVTDGHSCTASSSATVTQPGSGLTAQASVTANIACFGNSTGAVTVSANGGISPYTYAWSTGSTNASVSNLPAGTYWVTVTENNSCQAFSSATVTQPALLTAHASVSSHVDCFGNSNGAVTVSASGGTSPYSYLWSNGNTSTSVNNLAPGTYLVTVTDNNSCTGTSSATVTQPLSALTANASVISHLSCNGGSDGSAAVSAGGGTTPYTYLWSNGNTNSTATGLAAGTAWVTVTDAHACTATASATLTQPVPVPTTVTGTSPLCQYATGLYQTTSGMSNYLWSVSAGGAISSGGGTGDHFAEVTWNGHGAQSVSVVYSNPPDGCKSAATKDVTVYPAPATVITGASTVTVGDTVTYYTPLVSGYTYSWNSSHGNALPCIPGMNCLTVIWDFPCGIINPGFVKVTVTDTSTGCISTSTLWITVNP